MRKSDGSYTYFVPDVAYHVNKWERGFHHAVNIQGSDHHGTVARVRAGLQGLNLGIPKTFPAYVLHKMVKVVRNGAEVKISKRAGRDRKSVVEGKSVSVRVDLGGRRLMKQKHKNTQKEQ